MGAYDHTKRNLFKAGSLVMVLLLILSMSIRHSILCDSGVDDETETGLQLARQSLEARLLNVEQEAMENTMVIERVLRLLKEKHAGASADRQPDLADLYTDAEKLAIEIDAAFDRIDDDIFAKGEISNERDVVGDTSSFDDFSRRGREENIQSPFDDIRRPPRTDEAGVAEAFRVQTDDRISSQRCSEYARQYNIIPQISWGDAPYKVQDEWRRLDCDSFMQEESAPF